MIKSIIFIIRQGSVLLNADFRLTFTIPQRLVPTNHGGRSAHCPSHCQALPIFREMPQGLQILLILLPEIFGMKPVTDWKRSQTAFWELQSPVLRGHCLSARHAPTIRSFSIQRPPTLVL